MLGTESANTYAPRDCELEVEADPVPDAVPDSKTEVFKQLTRA